MNSDNTKCIHFTGTTQITFPPDLLLLENVNSHRVLSLFVGYDLKRNHHGTKMLHEARQSLFALKSNLPFNTRYIMKLQLYHSMVLLILLYGLPAWYPDITSLKRLEYFQRSCLSRIFGRKRSYQEDLKRSLFLPICYHLEYIPSFLCQLLHDR